MVSIFWTSTLIKYVDGRLLCRMVYYPKNVMTEFLEIGVQILMGLPTIFCQNLQQCKPPKLVSTTMQNVYRDLLVVNFVGLKEY